MDFNQELVDKLREYAQIHATSQTGGKGSRSALFFADEAVSHLLMKWCQKPLKEHQQNDNFYFISVKNTVINMITKYNGTKKRSNFLDYNNVQLDVPYEGYTLEMLDETTEEDYIEAKGKEEEDIQEKIDIIVNTLQGHKWVTEFDVRLFVENRLNGKTLKRIAKETGMSPRKITLRNTRIKNVLNHIYEQHKK